MTRKFNKPPCYPWVYDTPSGKATVCAPMPDGLGYVGFVDFGGTHQYGQIWNDEGYSAEEDDDCDLQDIPRRLEYSFQATENVRLVCEYDANTGDNATITKVK